MELAPPGVSKEGAGGARNFMKKARRVIVALSREELVADTHLDIIGFPGKQQQRRVLRLPAEPCDGAGIAAPVGRPADAPLVEVRCPIWMSADAHSGFGGLIGREICHDRPVRNRFDETATEDGCGNAERYIVITVLCIEVFLNRGATRCVTGFIMTAADNEERMHAAIGTAIWILLESGFDNGTVTKNERGHRIFCARKIGLWINARRRPPDGRLRMTARAAIEIEPWPKPTIGASNRFGLYERHLSGSEERRLIGR